MNPTATLPRPACRPWTWCAAGYQPGLLRAYVVWAAVVLALYGPCRWYQGYKRRHSHWWRAVPVAAPPAPPKPDRRKPGTLNFVWATLPQ